MPPPTDPYALPVIPLQPCAGAANISIGEIDRLQRIFEFQLRNGIITPCEYQQRMYYYRQQAYINLISGELGWLPTAPPGYMWVETSLPHPGVPTVSIQNYGYPVGSMQNLLYRSQVIPGLGWRLTPLGCQPQPAPAA